MDPSRVEGREINLHIISLLREAHKTRRETLAMGKNQRKRSRPTASTESGAWKSVSVTLPGGEKRYPNAFVSPSVVAVVVILVIDVLLPKSTVHILVFPLVVIVAEVPFTVTVEGLIL